MTGFSGTGTWSADYKFTNPTSDGYDATLFASPIDYVSQTEYWSVQDPAGGQSDLTISLDGSSDVANAVSNLSNLRFVGWDGAQWVQVGGTPTVAGTATSGTISTGAAIDFDSYQYITLGSNQPITLGTASIVSGDVSICNGASTDIIISLTGTTPWSITYTDGVTPVTIPGVLTSPYTLSVNPTSTTTYTLTAVSDNIGPGTLVGNIDVIVTVNTLPVPTITGDANACEGSIGNIYSTESSMGSYTWVVSGGGMVTAGGTIFDNSVTVTWTGTGAQSISVNYTNLAGCTASSPTNQAVTVNPEPIPALAGSDTLCVGAAGIIYTTDAGMTTYNWILSAEGSVTAGGGVGDNTVTVAWITTGTGNVSINYMDTNNCQASTPTDMDIEVMPVPVTGPVDHIDSNFNP